MNQGVKVEKIKILRTIKDYSTNNIVNNEDRNTYS